MATLHGMVVRTGGDAVIFFDGRNESKLTYEDLHQIAAAIAALLKESIRVDGMRKLFVAVGIYMEMSVVVPACILGALEVSCYFVYLSPNESVTYLKKLIDRAEVQYLITDRTVKELESAGFQIASCAGSAIEETVRVVKLATSTAIDIGMEVPVSSAPQLAYVMFTSGTTGDSKMVWVPHCCIVPNILHLWQEYKMSPSDVVFLSSPLTFDPSIVDMFLALSSGAPLLIVADVVKMQPLRLAEILFRRYRVTILQTTPTLLLRFPSSVLKRILYPSLFDVETSLRILTLGGEPFPSSVLAPYLSAIGNGTLRRLRIYNIYGTTETSCWSTIHRVTAMDMLKDNVPIGLPMLGTEMRLKDKTGNTVDQDSVIGEIYTGGSLRRCFVDDELREYNWRECPPVLRPTGDLAVRITDEQNVKRFYLIGRADEQTKRLGKRLNLSEITKVIKKNVNVRNCVTTLDDSNTLRVFVELHDNLPPSVDRWLFFETLTKEMKKSLLNSFPRQYHVDRFHLVDALPVTRHGKLNKNALMELASKYERELLLPSFSFDTVEYCVTSLLKDFLGVLEGGIHLDTPLRQLGLDSLSAFAFVSNLERWTRRKLPSALEITLTGTVGGLLQYLKLSAKGKLDTKGPANLRENSTYIQSPIPAKRTKFNYPAVELRVIEKGGRVRLVGCTNGTMALEKFGNNGGAVINVGVKWKWNSGKCIDASPVVVEDLSSGDRRVFIGSHSGKFGCLDCETGAVVWQQSVDGRIEATATVTECGEYVVVGCYEGGVYFFDRLSGSRWWRFATGEAVKCTACVGGAPFVYIGSHDHRLYKLNYKVKHCVWSVHLGGAIFSTPALSVEHSRLYVATLSGLVYCLRSDDGEEIWCQQTGNPVFSSILVVDGCVITTSVHGVVHWFSTVDGSLVRHFDAKGPIFSTPSLYSSLQSPNNESFLIFTCGNRRLFCLRESDAGIVWIKELEKESLSSPFTRQSSYSDGIKATICCVVTKSGVVHFLRMEDGDELGRCILGDEVFSSPVIATGCVFLGCRDDSLYCLQC